MLIVEDVFDKVSQMCSRTEMQLFLMQGAKLFSLRLFFLIIHLHFPFVNADYFSGTGTLFLFSLSKMQETLYNFSFLCKSSFFYRLPAHFVV